MFSRAVEFGNRTNLVERLEAAVEIVCCLKLTGRSADVIVTADSRRQFTGPKTGNFSLQKPGQMTLAHKPWLPPVGREGRVNKCPGASSRASQARRVLCRSQGKGTLTQHAQAYELLIDNMERRLTRREAGSDRLAICRQASPAPELVYFLTIRSVGDGCRDTGTTSRRGAASPSRRRSSSTRRAEMALLPNHFLRIASCTSAPTPGE